MKYWVKVYNLWIKCHKIYNKNVIYNKTYQNNVNTNKYKFMNLLNYYKMQYNKQCFLIGNKFLIFIIYINFTCINMINLL